MIYYAFYPYKNWRLLLLASANGLVSIDIYYGKDISSYTFDPNFMRPYTDYLDNFFKGLPNKEIQLDIKGTPFQLAVWKNLMNIKKGMVTTYKEIAQALGKPNAYRAVGNAVGKNPILLLIPCHRVIKTDGSLGGFSSDINLKIDLLNHEGKNLYKKTL